MFYNLSAEISVFPRWFFSPQRLWAASSADWLTSFLSVSSLSPVHCFILGGLFLFLENSSFFPFLLQTDENFDVSSLCLWRTWICCSVPDESLRVAAVSDGNKMPLMWLTLTALHVSLSDQSFVNVKIPKVPKTWLKVLHRSSELDSHSCNVLSSCSCFIITVYTLYTLYTPYTSYTLYTVLHTLHTLHVLHILHTLYILYTH